MLYNPDIGSRDRIFLWGLNLPLYMDMPIRLENYICIIYMQNSQISYWKNINGMTLFDIIRGLFSQLSTYGSIEETLAYLDHTLTL